MVGGVGMKRIVETAVSLSLLALGCGQVDRGGAGAPPAESGQGRPAVATPAGGDAAVPVVRVAELEIDPAQLESYQAAVKEEMETSVRVESGVLAIYCVAEKDNPAKLRFFEMYADEAAYKAHIDSPHFRKYVEATKAMIRSRKLIETVPVQMSAKKR
jgi:quinol monooxygenase YgiN